MLSDSQQAIWNMATCMPTRVRGVQEAVNDVEATLALVGAEAADPARTGPLTDLQEAVVRWERGTVTAEHLALIADAAYERRRRGGR